MIYFLLFLGFVLLIKGADWLVDGATAIASRMGISHIIIGLTIVSMGTSMPELIVSMLASYEGRAGLSIGNILGSNIANVLLILGVTAIICELPVRRNTILSEIPISLAAALLIGFLANSALWYEEERGLYISTGDGIIIFFFFLLFLAYALIIAREDKQSKLYEKSLDGPDYAKSVVLIIGGISALFLGGKWVVDGSVHLAKLFGLSETLIGLTVIALGTSLPELVTSISAALKRNTDIAIGNAVGSNIFNLLWILGFSAMVNPLPFDTATNMDILAVIASTCLMILAMLFGRRMSIKRVEGFLFLIAYIIYLVAVVKRG